MPHCIHVMPLDRHSVCCPHLHSGLAILLLSLGRETPTPNHARSMGNTEGCREREPLASSLLTDLLSLSLLCDTMVLSHVFITIKLPWNIFIGRGLTPDVPSLHP